MKQRSRHAGCDVTRWPTSRGIVSSVSQCVTTTNLFPVSVRVASLRSGGSRPGVAGTLYFSIKRRYTPAAVLLHVVRWQCCYCFCLTWQSVNKPQKHQQPREQHHARIGTFVFIGSKKVNKINGLSSFPTSTWLAGWLAGRQACWLCVSAFCCWFSFPRRSFWLYQIFSFFGNKLFYKRHVRQTIITKFKTLWHETELLL